MSEAVKMAKKVEPAKCPVVKAGGGIIATNKNQKK
jgi:hypothetical protein